MATSAKQRVRNAIVYNLQQIDKTGSYNTKIMEAVPYPVWDRSRFTSLPACSIVQFIDTGFTSGADGQNKIANVFIDCVLDSLGEGDLTDAQDAIQADIERRFANFYWMPEAATSASTPTCTDPEFVDATPYGSEETGPDCGIVIQYKIHYAQDRKNPNTTI